MAAYEPPVITLRPVTAQDREFLLQAYAAGREFELSLVPWDEAMKRAFVEHQFDAQNAHYQQEMPGSTHEIIVIDNEPGGRIYLHRTPTEIAILDLVVLPRFRKQGVATRLISDLQAEAAREGKSIRIFIENFNSAASLLQKLGFTVTSDDGVNRRYEWVRNKETY